MPIVLDPKKINKSSDKLWKEMQQLPQKSIARQKKYREYLTKNFYEQGLPPPEFEEDIQITERMKPNEKRIESIHRIKCWEYQPAEVKSGIKKNMEGWDQCAIYTKGGDMITVQGVAHIVMGEDELGYNYEIDEMVSDDDLFLLKLKGEADLNVELIKKKTSSGDLGIYTDLFLFGHSPRELLSTPPSMFKENLRKDGYDEKDIEYIMQERKNLFQSNKPLHLKKYIDAIIKQNLKEIDF